MTSTATAAHQDVIRAAVGHVRFAAIKGRALDAGRDVAEAFDAELTEDEKIRILYALEGAPLDHDALTAGLGADRYREIWSGALMPSTPDHLREAVIRAALAAYVDPVSGLGVAELMAPAPAEPAAAPAKRTPPAGPRVSTRRVAGGVDGRDFAYVGRVMLGRKVLAECGHEHANRDQSSGVAGGSAKSCAQSILDGARRPATADYVAGRLRTAPIGLRPGAGFQHPAGTIEAAREAAEKNAATYLAAVADVRPHLDTLEEPLPDTDPTAGQPAEAEPALEAPAAAGDDQPEPRCLDAGPSHTCSGVVRYRPALTDSGVNHPRCDAAWTKRLDLQDRHRAAGYDSPVAPSWFDPTYAGERWGEDEY